MHQLMQGQLAAVDAAPGQTSSVAAMEAAAQASAEEWLERRVTEVTESAALASRHGHSKPPVEAPELYDIAVRFPHVAALLDTDFGTLDTLQFSTATPSALHTSSSRSHLMAEPSGGEPCFSFHSVGEQINSISLRRDRELLRTTAKGAVDSKLGARPVGEKAQVLLRQRLQKRVTCWMSLLA
jgi:hypothetical protein